MQSICALRACWRSCWARCPSSRSAGCCLSAARPTRPPRRPRAALGGLTLLYVGYGFQILAGLLGICLAGRRSLLTVILGVLLFVVQLVGFLNTSGMVEIVINIVLLVIPYYYLHNAYKIYRAK